MSSAEKKNKKQAESKASLKRDSKGHFAKSDKAKKNAPDDGKVKINIAPEKNGKKPEDSDKESEPRVIGVMKITETKSSATGTTSRTTTYNLKSDGTRETVTSCEEGVKIGDNSTRPQMEHSISPDLETIASQNPARIEVGGHPYYSNKYVADAQAAAVRNTTPSDFDILARLQKVNELIEQRKRLRRREMAKRLARGTAQIIMWALTMGILACAGVGIYTLGTQVCR